MEQQKKLTKRFAIAASAALALLTTGLSGVAPTQAQTATASVDATSIDGIVARADLHQGHADILRLYTAFFDRQPDAGGALYWVAQYNTCGWSTTRIADFFSVSPEFTATHESLSNEAFVALLYTNVLDRAADGDGVRYWTARLDSGESRGSVVADFAFSEEFRASNPLPSDGRPNTGCVENVLPVPTPLSDPIVAVNDCSTFTVTMSGADGYALNWQVVTYAEPTGIEANDRGMLAVSGTVGPAGPITVALPEHTTRIEVSAIAAGAAPTEVIASAAVLVDECAVSHVQQTCASASFVLMLPAGTHVLGPESNRCEQLVLPDGTDLSASHQTADADAFVAELAGHWDDDINVVSDTDWLVDGQTSRALTITGSGDETIRLWSIKAWGPGYWQLSAVVPNTDIDTVQPSIDGVATSLVYLVD